MNELKNWVEIVPFGLKEHALFQIELCLQNQICIIALKWWPLNGLWTWTNGLWMHDESWTNGPRMHYRT